MSFSANFEFGLLAAIVLSIPSPAVAEEPTAPRATIDGKQLDIAIGISGFGMAANPGNPPMRLPQPLSEPVEWFGAGSQLVQAHMARPEKLGFTRIMLEVDISGAIAECMATGRYDLPVDAEAVCADFAVQKFLPALDNEGQRVAANYIVNFTPRRYDAEDSPHPLFPRDGTALVVPPPAPLRVDSKYLFPPESYWMSTFYRPPQWRTAPQIGLPDDIDQPLTGVLLFDKGTGLECRVVKRSSPAAQDNAACTYAKSVLKPAWTDASAQNHRGVPLYVSAQAEATLAYAPAPDYQRDTTISEDSELRFITALTNSGVFPEGREASPLHMYLTPDAAGRVAHCSIMTSTGSDAGDIAACRAARKTVVMQPMEDIFGRMSEYAGLVWAANPTRP